MLFTFSVDKSAPVGKEQMIRFSATSSTGEKWAKEVKVTVSPPKHFEVANLVEAERPAGYHQEVWDAARFSSGMYVYQLTATD